MTPRTLTNRDLNRAMLTRQMLVERVSLPVAEAIERLGGLHAQIPAAPYIGLWSRLTDFQRDDLATLLENREVIKATTLRGTLHYFTRADYLRFLATFRPLEERFWELNIKGKTLPDVNWMVEEARRLLEDQPRSHAEIVKHFTAIDPDLDANTIRWAARTYLPQVQVPADKKWSYSGTPKWALAEQWLGELIPTENNLRELVRRYLRAFGPGSADDMKTWSNLPGLKAVFKEMRDELVIYRHENGAELFDLPDMPLPDGDTPIPVRFIGDLDNIMFSHDDRTWIIADVHRRRWHGPNAIGRPIFLVDGMVRGEWKVESSKQSAALSIIAWEPIAKADRDALVDEAERLIRFMEPDTESVEVRFIE